MTETTSGTTSAPRPSTRGFATVEAPVFGSLAEERTHIRQRLAGVCRIFGKAGFSEGLLGHITVRDPYDPDAFWANPVGISFNRMRASDVVQVNHAGELLVGNRPVNPVGLLLHAAIHRALPDVSAVCHAHSTFGSAWSTFAEPVPPLTQDTSVFFEDQAIIREPRIAMDPAQADGFAAGFGNNKVGIQVGHGIFTTGRNVDEAAWWFISMDKACQIALLTRAAGNPELWPDEAARGVKSALGSSEFGWLSFQTLWDEIVESDPGLLD
jgi:ribulose-5-phosphate 4-epimerase/fuculose-1-phosphate aldolase